MKPASLKAYFILAMYLIDELLSEVLPFSSGPFAVALLIACVGHATIYKRVAIAALVWSSLTFGIGLLGASFSGTPLSVLSFATPVLFAGIWIMGAGMREGKDVLISPRLALIGTLISCGFLLLSAAGLDVMGLVRGHASQRPAGILSEPSHYALYVTPLWLIAYQVKGYRLWLYLALAAQFVLCFSTTLLSIFLMLGIVSLYVNFRRRINLNKIFLNTAKISMVVVPAFLASSLVVVGNMPVSEYVVQRVSGLFNVENTDVQNLSSLVVVQGIELAQVSFSESNGLGVGLANLGTSPGILEKTTTRALISALLKEGGDLNLRDGGLLANKLVGELGFQAFLIPLLFIVYLRRMKALQDSMLRHYHAIFAALLLCLLFIRVLPYFSAPVVLVFFSLAAVLNNRRREAVLQEMPRGA